MIWLILYAIACTGLAAWNADLINDGKKIFHGLNGLLHIMVAVLIGIFVSWNYGLAIIFIAKLFFDTSLNAWRGLPLDYLSPEVKRYKNLQEALHRGKTTDYIEYKIFNGNMWLAKIVYAAIITLLIII